MDEGNEGMMEGERETRRARDVGGCFPHRSVRISTEVRRMSQNLHPETRPHTSAVREVHGCHGNQ